MKRKKWFSSLLAGCLCLTLCMPFTVHADGQKVVTLGADLTPDQKAAVLKYFGVYGQNIQTLTITNQDERAHLGAYVPLEQIGTRTFSCALVCPTNSGGIQVKTANLSWVTSNMIATTLSTSGVVNCDVLAAAPFEVSGTGALTGIIMAYESACGITLDPVRKDLATKELITTGQIADSIGQKQATNIVNEIKIQVIEGAVVEPDEVEVIVEEIVDENPEVSLSDEDRALLTGLMTQIAEQQYDYEEVRDTLQRVEENLGTFAPVEEPDEEEGFFSEMDEIPETEPTEISVLAPDSILLNTDDSALGENVVIDATDEAAVSSDPVQSSDAPAGEDTFFEITSSDDYAGEEANGTEDDFWSEDTASDGSEDDFWSEDTASDGSEDDFWSEDTASDGSEDDFWSEDTSSDGSEDWAVMDGSAMDDGVVDAAEEFSADSEIPADIPALELTECRKTPDCSNGSITTAGAGQIKLVYGNSNLVPVSGVLNLTDAAGNLCAVIDLTDSDQVHVSPISSQDMMNYGWEEGTQLLINLGYCLEPEQSYTVQVDGVLACTGDASVLEGVPTSYIGMSWPIETDRLGAALSVGRIQDLSAGSSVSGNVLMQEGIAYAAISSYDAEKISFDTVEFSPEATGFTMSCLQSGTAFFALDYFDGEGNYIGSSSAEVFIP